MVRVGPKGTLTVGLVLLVIGILVIVHITITYGVTECTNVNITNNSCFTIKEPGIVCVKGAEVTIPGLKEVNVPTLGECKIQYSASKAGTYCVSSASSESYEISLCRLRELGLSDLLYWCVGAVMILSGGGILYLYLTSTKTTEGELLSRYVIGEGAVCRSLSLTRHECRIKPAGSNAMELIRKISGFMQGELGYRRRELTDTYAILTRGNIFGLGNRKPVTLLIYVNRDEVILEFRVAPLQASGLYDLKRFAREVEELLKNLTTEHN